MRSHVGMAAAFCLCFAAVAEGQSSAPIQLQRIASGLQSPLFVTAAPGRNDQLFIAQRGGAIRSLDLTTNTLASTPAITIGGLATGNEQGLLGLAFDPDYATNGFLYVNIVETGGAFGNGRTVIRRYQVDGNPLTAATINPSSATTILQFDQPRTNHNGGWIGFRPGESNLYIATGDSGGGNDPDNVAQNLNSPLGKILRVDPRTDGFAGDPNRNYSNPNDNPFVGNAAALDEVWLYGVRNPYRNSFDRLTGDLVIADVGQNAREEINFQPATSAGGENYGWRLREGTIPTGGGVGGNRPPGAIDPIYEYEHGNGPLQGNSVTGGYVYRGTDPTLYGKYVFGDFLSGNVWALRIAGTDPSLFNGTNFTEFERLNDRFVTDFGTVGNIASFGEDNFGNLYLVDFDGEIFRFASTAVPEPMSSSLVVLASCGAAWIIRRRPRVATAT